MRYLFFLPVFIFFACNSKEPVSESVVKEENKNIEYAKGFDLKNIGDLQILTIKQPYQSATEVFNYYLISKYIPVPDTLANKAIIRTPVNEIVVTSTSHIPMLDYLDETNSLTGFPTLDYVSSSAARARIDSGDVKELGRDNQLNFEVLVQLQPELVMTYMLTGDGSQLKRIEQAGIPVLINSDYLEHHPLGRAEWIKVAGALFEKSKQADSVFNEIRDRYLSLQEKVDNVENRPTVFTGIMYGDTWFLPGGKNYSAILFKDAGMNYLWRDNKEHGFLELSFETVYEKAKDANLWIGVASIEKLNDLKNTDSRYSWFETFNNGEIYSYTAKTGATGGNEYLELGYLRPDLILADLIKIAHPEIPLPHELYFYKKLD